MISKITPDNIKNPPPSDASWIEKTIPFLGGRPDRDLAITPDDILNLIIACNTSGSLEEFLYQT